MSEILVAAKRVLLCLFILIIQYVFADSIRIFGVAPNIVFSFIIVIAFINDYRFNISISVILGVLLDCLSGRIFGVYTLTFVLINFLVFEFYHSAFSENFLVETIYGFIAMLGYSISFAFFTSFFKGNFFILFTKISLIECIYNFLIFEAFLIIQKKLMKKKKSIFN